MTEPPPGDVSYTPSVSEEYAERIRRWHEEGLRAARAKAGIDGQTFDYMGLTLYVPPQVQPIYPVSRLVGVAVLKEVGESDRVLDMGTGSGVNAILAASKAAEVVAVDINPVAIEAARNNAVYNGVADRIEVRRSDVFSNVAGKFDLIIFDPPFRWFAPRDLLEAATADENYRALSTFFRKAQHYLVLNGRMLIFFGSSGDLVYLNRLIDGGGFAAEVVAEELLVQDDWRIEYYTYRLTVVQ